MTNLLDLNAKLRSIKQVESGGGGGENMEHRVTALETRLDAILPTLATKGDVKADIAELRAEMHEGFSGMVKWIVGSALALGVAGITVITFALNNATPRTAPQAQPQPIIINIPAQPQPHDLSDKK